nr:GDSL esterase/lipase At5g08460 [Ipomoea batatas]
MTSTVSLGTCERAMIQIHDRTHSREVSSTDNDAPVLSPNTRSPPLVPALFVIKDSSIDYGNRKVRLTDRLPYGWDFDTRQVTNLLAASTVKESY